MFPPSLAISRGIHDNLFRDFRDFLPTRRTLTSAFNELRGVVNSTERAVRGRDEVFCGNFLFEDPDMQTAVTKKRFNVFEYYRMAEAGILSDSVRTELINGEIIEMSPMGARHAGAVSRINELLVPLLKGKAQLRPQLPLRLNIYDEPLPDFCFVRPRRDFYSSKHPGSAETLLAIEVSDTSLSYDRDVKCGVYASSRVQIGRAHV